MSKNNIKKVFIQLNNKQLTGACVAKYAIEKNLPKNTEISVEILNVDNLDVFKEFTSTSYIFYKKEERIYTLNDLQSFTLVRFMPPELMSYEGTAIVIDPDVFSLVDINELFNIDMQDKAIACCKKKDAWDSSIMLLDCSKLKHWNIENILNQLKNKKIKYKAIMTLQNEKSILEIPRIWNSLDILNEKTKLLHLTQRLTQPWKSGLQIDFTRNKMPKLFGIIPREVVHKILGKYNTHYLPHPNKDIEKFFFSLLREMLQNKVITTKFLQEEISRKHIRKDSIELIS